MKGFIPPKKGPKKKAYEEFQEVGKKQAAVTEFEAKLEADPIDPKMLRMKFVGLDLNSIIDPLIKNFCLTEINSFPIKVFRELITEWYGQKVMDKVQAYFPEDKPITIKLRAAAEPQDPEMDKDPDDEDSAVRTNNININNTNDILEKLQPEAKEQSKDSSAMAPNIYEIVGIEALGALSEITVDI